MPRERKSPQKKKQLEYTRGHFTFAEYPHAFRKGWPRKKAQSNRTFRHEADGLLAQAQPGVCSEEAERVTDDVTVERIKKLITGKKLHKSSTVTIGEKVELTLQKRKEMTGRRVSHKRRYDEIARTAVNTLHSLDADQLIEFVRRAAIFNRGGDPIEWARVMQSEAPCDRALAFLHNLGRGSAHELEALRRNETICKRFQDWRKKANRILMRDRRVVERKAVEKVAAKKSRRSTGGK